MVVVTVLDSMFRAVSLAELIDVTVVSLAVVGCSVKVPVSANVVWSAVVAGTAARRSFETRLSFG